MNLNEMIRILFLTIILILITTAATATEVPKSETIIIPGELNDSKENAQIFDNELEYVYGSVGNITKKSLSKGLYSTSNAITPIIKDSWRKTNFQNSGTLVVTLSYDIDSNYSVEVYNSCSNKNYCEEYEFGTYKTCVMNIQPGDYYFKVKNISGSGKYYLDVDIIKEEYKSEISAWECTKVKCLQDSDCGTNGFEGQKYCKNNESYQKYTKHNCNNPGRDSAICTSSQEEVLVETCNSCFNGECTNLLTLNCPSFNINEDYSFTWNALDYTLSTIIEFSPSADFKSKKTVNVKSLNALPIKKYYSTLIKYENNSKEKKVYARLVGKKTSKEKKYSETCTFNLTQKTNSILNCPTEPINENYSFSFERKNTTNPYLQISYTNNFSTGKTTKINSKKTEIIPISKYYKNILNYNKKNETLYARIIGKDSYGRNTTSNICEFKIASPKNPILNCPTNPINQNYSFEWDAGDYSKTITLQISYQNEFKTKTSINATKLNPTPISKYYKTLQNYSTKTPTKELYARILAKNKYNQTITSNICKFKLTTTTLSEEDQENKTAYFGVYQQKTNIISNPNPINHYSESTQITNNNNIEETQPENVLPIINPEETILSQTTELNENGDTIVKTVIQRTNEFGETETGVIYQITPNSNNYFAITNNLIQPTGTSCTYSYTDKRDTCSSEWQFYSYSFTSTNYPKVIYRFIDCKTGDVLGKGELCSGELSPKHYRPEGHKIKVEYDFYQCPDKQCKKESINLCSGVTCSDYCWKGDRYYNGSCKLGVCNYTKNTCPDKSCTEGSCQAACNGGCPDYCSGSKLYNKAYCSNSKCIYDGYMNCPNGCSNGACNSSTCQAGWKCKNTNYKGYQKSDCTWTNETYCSNGCSNGECKSSTCSTGWKCINEETRGYRNSDCTWDDEEYCEYGCSSGECNEEPISHAYSKCSNGDRYWYNSLDQKEDKREECGSDEEGKWETPYCNGNTIERKRTIIDRYCSSDRCKSNPDDQIEEIETCPEGCKNGGCINLPKPGDNDYCTQEKPCQAGIGNCKKNNDCQAGLICVEDTGAKYGYASSVNVCEAALNIYNTSGWTCKNPDTMAYLLSDGSYTSEIPCKHGCSNGSCYMPPFCDSQSADLTGMLKTQKISFAGIDSNKGKIKFSAYIAEYALSTAFVMTATTTIIMALIGTTILAYNNQVYESVNWQNYDGEWVQGQLEDHYNKHNSEFGFKDIYEFRDKCAENYNNRDSVIKQQYIEDSAYGKVFIVRDAFSQMVSMVNDSGKMFACYMVGDKALEVKIKNNGWGRLPKIPQCTVII